MTDPEKPSPAYVLWVELATRIATQPLHYRAGDEETAARSIFSLFKLTRGLLENNPTDGPFRKEALNLLNVVLREYTARWHGWMVEDRTRPPDSEGKLLLVFRDAVTRHLFRAELRELQPLLIQIKGNLARLAGITDTTETPRRRKARLGHVLIAGIGRQVKIAATAELPGENVPGRINKDERDFITKRRAALEDKTEPATQLTDAVGLALSGGGIRSATFCLGIVQKLVEKKIFAEFDYLSTVSGGGYLGSFLSCSLGTNEEPVAKAPSPKIAAGNEGGKIDAAMGVPKVGAEKKPADDEALPPRTDAPPSSAPWNRKQIMDRIAEVFDHTPDGTESSPLRHLRNNSKYLISGGAMTRVRIICLLAAGIAWNLLMVGWIPLALALVAFLADARLRLWGGAMAADALTPWPALLTPAGVLFAGGAILAGCALLVVPLVQRLSHGAPPRSYALKFRSTTILASLGVAVGLVIAAAIYVQPALFKGYHWFRTWLAGSGKLSDWMSTWMAPAAAGGGTAFFGLLTAWLKPHWVKLRAVASHLFILSGPLFFLLLYLMVGNRLGLGSGVACEPLAAGWAWQWVMAVAGALVLWSLLCVNLNTIAPHMYYRAKLCDCYLARRTKDELRTNWPRKIRRWLNGHDQQGHTETLLQLPFSELNSHPAAPYHLLNTTLNLPDSENKELRGRNGDFFSISKYYCGAPTVGYRETSVVTKKDPHLDLGTALAVSGAAASTSMGWKSLPNFRFILTMLNVRLGYWLYWGGSTMKVFPPGLWYFLKEMAASFSESDRYLNLSDGGHIENLAAYELLRRRSKFIVCVDAGQEPGMECADLTRLERYAAIDLGIQFEYSIADLSLLPNGYSQASAILVKVIYPGNEDGETEILTKYDRDVEGEARREAGESRPAPRTSAKPLTFDQLHEKHPAIGWMLYIKLAITGTEPVYVLDYRRENPAFPHQSTADQLYDEAQFEAYRRLGECSAENLFRRELFAEDPASVRDWFQGLADNLLADNDPVFQSPQVAMVAAGGLEGGKAEAPPKS